MDSQQLQEMVDKGEQKLDLLTPQELFFVQARYYKQHNYKRVQEIAAIAHARRTSEPLPWENTDEKPLPPVTIKGHDKVSRTFKLDKERQVYVQV